MINFNRKYVFLAFIFLFLLLSSCVSLKKSGLPAAIEPEPQAVTPPPVETKKEITVSFAGDCTLGGDRVRQGYYGHFDWYFSEIAKKDYSYFLSGVKEIFQKDDYTIVNLEGPLTKAENIREKDPKAAAAVKSKKKQAKPAKPAKSKKIRHRYYNFKGIPEYAAILSSGSVEAVSTANNHSYDYGKAGYDETLETLKKAGIDYAGYDDYILKDIKGIKTGILSYAQVSHNPASKEGIKAAIESLKKQGAQIIIVCQHNGTEGSSLLNEPQKDLAHFIIDSGADIYVGHHPHVLQGIELYKGKYILYSLGNFVFGGNSNPKDKDTLIVQAHILIDGEKKEISLNLIPASISSVKTRNDYKPSILEGDEKKRVLDKINEMSKDLNFKFEYKTEKPEK